MRRIPRAARPDKPEGVNLPFIDSVQPILDAGLARLVEGNETLFPGIDLMPIPGHTPGMMAIRVRSRGEEALFAGDIAHQPIQVAYAGLEQQVLRRSETIGGDAAAHFRLLRRAGLPAAAGPFRLALLRSHRAAWQ